MRRLWDVLALGSKKSHIEQQYCSRLHSLEGETAREGGVRGRGTVSSRGTCMGGGVYSRWRWG